MSSDSTRVARFADVTPSNRRCPSWIAKQHKPTQVEAPKTARLPREFLAAFQREIQSASEVPPGGLPPRGEFEPDRELASSVRHEAPKSRPSSLPPAPSPEPAGPDPRMLEGLTQAIEQVVQVRADVLAQTASQLAELAVMIARRVIARELSISPNVVHGLVSEGLDALGAHDRVVVRLGAGFSDLREEVQARLLRGGAACEVRVDGALAQWGCVVETELGSVDESVESRLATLLQALKPDSNPPG